MTTSNVRNIESLETFHGQLLQLSGDWDIALQELRMLVARADEYFSQARPAYWRSQLQVAERELTEAKDHLSQKRSAARAENRPAATEAVQRVHRAEQRLRTCQDKLRLAKTISTEISRQCDDVLGPLAEVTEHCQVVLPGAAGQLRTLIDQLRAYTDHSTHES